jgi:hypothetical protein
MLSYTTLVLPYTAPQCLHVSSQALTLLLSYYPRTRAGTKLHSTSSKQHYTGMAAATYVVLDRASEQRPQGLLTVS